MSFERNLEERVGFSQRIRTFEVEGVCKRNNRVHGQKVGGCLSLLGLPQQTGWLKQEKSICQSSGGWGSRVRVPA